MAVNKRKVLDAARKYAQKGAKEKALKEYNTLLKLDPRDAKLHLEIGDAYRRWGQLEEAIAQYVRVAEQYQQEGFDARAVAVFKQILNLDPKRYTTYVALAELYQHMGLDSEAIGALQTAADGYHKEGQRREALDLLRRMAALDPTNTTSRIKVADLLRQEGLEEDAVSEYEGVAEELRRESDIDSLLTVYERILEIQPERVDILVATARTLVELKNPDRAEPFARRALTKAPEEPEHYELLCDIYKTLDKVEALIDTTRSLAKLHRERGDEARAREVIQRLPASEAMDADEHPELSLEEPVEEDPRDQFELSDGDLSDPGKADDLAMGEQELLDDDEFFESGADVVEFDLDTPEQSPTPAEPLIEVASSPELDAGDSGSAAAPSQDSLPEGDPDQLLAEASVYLRYGKTEQAISSLRNVLNQDPGHRAALEKLGEAFAEANDSEQAIEAWVSAAKRAGEEGDHAAVAVLRDRVAALDPGAAAAIEVPEAPEAEAAAEIDLETDLDDFELGSSSDAEASQPQASVALEADGLDLDALETTSDDIDSGDIDIEIDASDFGDDELLTDSAEFDVELDFDAEDLSHSDSQPRAERDAAADLEVELESQPDGAPDEASFDELLLGEASAESSSDESAAQASPEIEIDVEEEEIASAAEDSEAGLEGFEIDLESDELDLGAESGDAADPGAESGDVVEAATEPAQEQATDPSEDTFSSDANDPASQSSSSAGASAATARQIKEDLEEAEFYFQQALYDDAEVIYKRILAAAPGHPAAMLRMGELAAARGDDPSVPTEALPSSDAPDSGEADAQAAVEAAADEDADPLIDTAPEEVEPLIDTAPEELELVIDTAPDEPASAMPEELCAEAPDAAAGESSEDQTLPMGDSPAGPDPQSESAEAESVEVEASDEDASAEQTDGEADTFDFAAELRDELEDDDERAEASQSAGGTQDVAFESVFNDFKKGVSETLSEGDHETRYDLGIAYREMELYDDAIGEFSRCLDSPERKLDSLCMLALCALDLDRGGDAVSHLEQALSMPELEDARRAGIQFDLGRAFRSLGDPTRARAAFEAVVAFDAAFPGAAKALAALDAPPEADAEEAANWRGESFDDLIAEVEEEDESEAAAAEPSEVFESFDDLVTDDPDIDADAAAESPARATPPEDEGGSANGKSARKKKKISFV